MRTKSRIQYLIRGLMAAELICAVILLVCFACMPRAQIVLDASNTQALQGAWQEDGRYVCMQGSAGVCLQSVPLSLDAGVYRAEVSYDADAEAALLLHDESGGYHQLLTTAVSMYDRTKATEASVGIYLKHHTDGAILEILYGAGAELTVSSLTLTATGQQYTIWLLWLLLISLLADGTLLLYDRWQRGVLSKAQLSCGMLLVAIWIVSCLPLMTDQAVYQDDLFFH
ncbi:MAG: hypothetical protein K6G23_06670, partial [Lachnospiraceae bacterium]|nr:hypothetical protein [Lachnospiraceae bacterium]